MTERGGGHSLTGVSVGPAPARRVPLAGTRLLVGIKTTHGAKWLDPLVVRARDDGAYTMDFPATPPEPSPLPDGFAEAFGVEPVWSGRSRFDLFAVLDTEAAVRALDPDHGVVAGHAPGGGRVGGPRPAAAV